MGQWFGSSGIRGEYPSPVNGDLAIRLGRAAAQATKRVLIGHDARLSSPLLAHAFAAGALSAGAAVDLAGGAATPSLAYGAREYGLAIAVTASHNPPQDNGFKFWNPDGSAWDARQEDDLEALLKSEPRTVSWDRLAPIGRRQDTSDRHRKAILDFVGAVRGPVVLDVGNGAGAWLTPRLFADAGLDVETLNGTPDGRFPSRPSEPAPENLTQLRSRCRTQAAWGIAHDGDADRMVPVAPDGNVVPPEVVLVTLALQSHAKRIATPVDASACLAQALPGVEWVFTRVGDAHVSAAVRAQKAQLGAETSGTYVVPTFSLAPDGPLAALLFLKAVREGLVDEAQRRTRPVHRRSEKVPLGDLTRDTLRARLAAATLRPHEKATRVDGLRVDEPRGWFLIRPSGTEPIVRLTAEALEARDLDALLVRARNVLDAARRAPIRP